MFRYLLKYALSIIVLGTTTAHADLPRASRDALVIGLPANASTHLTSSATGQIVFRFLKDGGFRIKRLSGAALRAERIQPRIGNGRMRPLHRLNDPCESKRVERLLARCPTCSCSPDWELNNSAVPNDPALSNLWGMYQNSRVDIHGPEAWDSTTGSNNVVIGVVDTGVQYTHPDLQANMWQNPDEIAGNGIDDDSNGYIDDVHGINAINDSGNPMDDHGHGTHVAGTIGAVGNNGIGISGVAWQVKIVGTKFLSSSGSGSLSNAIQCLDYLTTLKQVKGINVVASNNSWGGGGYSQPLAEAIERANTAGILFVAAAGNSTQNLDALPAYPASYTNGNIIRVGSVTAAGQVSSFSNYGVNTVHIGAPGSGIYSTYLNGSYGYMSGTSMAAPHVSGVIALVAAKYPSLSSTALRQAIINGGRTISALNTSFISGRFLDATGALAVGASLMPTPTPPDEGEDPAPNPEDPDEDTPENPGEGDIIAPVVQIQRILVRSGRITVLATLNEDSGDAYVSFALKNKAGRVLREGGADLNEMEANQRIKVVLPTPKRQGVYTMCVTAEDAWENIGSTCRNFKVP